MGPMGMPPMGRMGMQGGPSMMEGGGTVVIVSNLCEEKVTPDKIYVLFGSYGPVTRVKILFNKKDTALVQYSDPMMAQNAIVQLDRVRWMDRTLKVSMSKHMHIQMPREGASDAWMTKDFTNSPLNRFRNANANKNVMYPPSPTLHLSNIPSSASEQDLTDMFTEYGTVVGFKYFEKDKKMGLLQMGSQEEAVDALVAIHNYDMGAQHYLRVSFTKSTIANMH